MTTREISEITGMDIKTVAKAVKKLLPDKITKKGTETVFTEEEGMVLLKGVKKRNLVEIQPRSNGVSPRSNGVSSDMADMREMVKELCGTVRDVLRSLKPGEAPKPAQIEAPSHYSIMGYAAIKHRPIDSTDARKLAYQARGICAERGLEVHKVADERFGEVNSYPVAVLAEVFA